MRTGRPTLPLVLTVEERQQLEALCRRTKAPQAEVSRARAILAGADGLNNSQISRKVGLCPHTVGRLRKRFHETRLRGIFDLPRSGAPRTISDEQVAEVIRLTLETKPRNAKRLPKLARPIVQAFRHSCSQRHRNRLRKEESAFCGVVREMIAANQWPSHRKLKSRLQKPGMLRNPALVNLRREILFPKKMPEEGKFDR